MGDTTTRKFDIQVGSTYNGNGVKSATADVAKLRKELSLPAMGPLSRTDAQIEKEATSRIRAMERAAEKSNIGAIVNERLFGGGGGGGAAKPRNDGLLGIINKFGTSNGTDAIVEKLAKIAPMIGGTLAVAKGAEFGLRYLNYREDVARHAAQGNLERQAADEASANSFMENVPVAGGLGREIADYFNFKNRHADRVAIEELEDATKRTDQYTATLERRKKIEAELRDNVQANADSLTLSLAKSKTTPERAAFLDAQEAQRIFEKKITSLAADVNPKKVAEIGAERAAHAAITIDAMKGSLVGDFTRTKDFMATFAGRFTDLVKESVGKLRDIKNLDESIRELRDRTAGRTIKADIDQIRAETHQAMADENDPAKRAKLAELGAARESAISTGVHRSLLADRAARTQQLLDRDSDQAIRRLNIAGQSTEGERLGAKQDFVDRLAGIVAAAKKDAFEHPELGDTINKRAKEDLGFARENFALSLDEIQQRKHDEFHAALPGDIHGPAGILTGTIGEGSGDSLSQLVSQNERTARASEALLKSNTDMSAKISELISAIQNGNLGVIGTSPQ